jgi:hypothetical protein
VLATEHLLRLGGLDFALDLIEPALEVGEDVFAATRPFDEDIQIVAAAPERLAQGHVVFETPPPLHHLLRFGLIAPEVRVRDGFLDLGELIVQAG